MGSTAGHLYRKWGWLAASLALIFTLSGVLARQQLQRTQQQTFRRELAEQISLMAHNLQRLETSPLTTKLRLDSLEIAIKTQAMLQKQAATSLLPADPDLARKLALAYLNLGRLTLATSNTEQLQTALPSLQTAQTMLEKLIAAQITAQPPATDLRYQLALALKTQAEIKTLTPLLRTAGIKNLQEAENLANNLVTTAPQNTEYRALLADCQLKIGDLLKTKQDFFSALTYYQRALQQRQEIVNKGDSTDQHNLAIIHRRVTAIYAAIADLLATQAATKYLAQQLYAEATISVQKTFPLILSLASESPRLVSETAEHHFQIGAILLKTGKLSEAEKNLTIARKEFQNLVAQDFNNAELQGRLADTCQKLGVLYQQKGLNQQSLVYLNDSLSRYQQIIKDAPGNRLAQQHLISVYKLRANSYFKLQRKEEVRQQITPAYELAKQLFLQQPTPTLAIDYLDCALHFKRFFNDETLLQQAHQLISAEAYDDANDEELAAFYKAVSTKALSELTASSVETCQDLNAAYQIAITDKNQNLYITLTLLDLATKYHDKAKMQQAITNLQKAVTSLIKSQPPS